MHTIVIILLPFLLSCEYVTSKFLYRTPSLEKEYDYIVVGAGSAGAVIANRLSKNENSSVLVVEAGGEPSGMTEVPIFVPFLIGSNEDWAYVTEPQNNAFLANENQLVYITRYRALGGCSDHNFMMYVRGNKEDFNQWARLGCEGWDWKNVLPFFMKSEGQTDPELQNNGYHGIDGELTVSPMRYFTPSGEASLKAAETAFKLPPGDYNGESQSVVAKIQVTQRDGRRCSTEKAFLRPAAGRNNLHILTNAHATKINFDGSKRAESVSFDYQNASHTIQARKEIILSAGVMGSPQLLLISGIGPKEDLEKLGISVIADLPVGKNLHDHVGVYGSHYAVNDSTSIRFSSILNPEIVGMFEDGVGPLTSPVTGEVTTFTSSKYQNASEDWPDLQIVSLATTLMPPTAYLKDDFKTMYQKMLDLEAKTIVPYVLRPKSRGYLRLRTTNIYDHPEINPRYLSEQEDVDVLVEGIKMAEDWMNAPEMQPFNTRKVLDVIPGCENLVGDKYYECFVRQMTATVFHPVGSCKMGAATDDTAVLDPQLRVKGVEGLRVADGSIMPVVVSGNTNAACIMIGEKAAHIILNSV